MEGESGRTISIYIHIPFCQKRCSYCRFVSYTNKNDLISPYFEALKKELLLYENNLKEKTVTTVYFGGGTPSFVDPNYIRFFFNFLKRNFDLAPNLEVTIEANPETVNIEKLENWFDTGINRLSLGFQSLNQKHLEILGRIHTVEKNIEAYNLARQVGFENINIDLIFGSLGETEEAWEETLKGAALLNPEHISVYELTLEPGTLLYQKILQKMDIPFKKKGYYAYSGEFCFNALGENEVVVSSRFTDDVIEAEKYCFAAFFLKSAGYIHYEVSNFARFGYECRHNLNYWKRGDF